MSAVPAIRKAKIPRQSAALAAPGAAGQTESRLEPAYCDHCGDSLAGLKVQRRDFGAGSKVFCCLGCAFIAEQIYLAAAGRRDYASLNEPAAEAARLAAATACLRVDVHGMVCAACALLVEHTLRRLPGVAAAQVDFAGAQAHVAFDPM
ncbi:MAG TPA: cation transporter, partial [Burkholderiaceae bacterium]|nr:cation transporter [Burkholderiaceae bacterium]